MLTLMTSSFIDIQEIDVFEDLLWVECYDKTGRFELTMALPDGYKFEYGQYIRSDFSDKIMVIESMNTKRYTRSIGDTKKNLSKIKLKGRSLEGYILSSRFLNRQTRMTGGLYGELQSVYEDNLIDPSDANRKIDNFIFITPLDPRVLSKEVDRQFTGVDLHTITSELCWTSGLGFSIYLIDKIFYFNLYSGDDRSTDQAVYPSVIFSSEYDNLVSSEYDEDYTEYSNTSYVAGEGEGTERIVIEVTETAYVGLDRREMFVDARDISSTSYGDEDPITPEEYIQLLANRGATKLWEKRPYTNFDAVIDHNNETFVFNKHFKIGDIVTLVGDDGNYKNKRLSEVVRSFNGSGTKLNLVFE